MTICIGMRAQDGIVIAADAEESDRYYKRAQQKIFSFIQVNAGSNSDPSPFAYAFTGAGDAGYLDAFFYRIMNQIPKQERAGAAFEKLLADEILEFHRRHLFPLAKTNDPPQIDVLVGAYSRLQTSIFLSHGSTVRSGGFNLAVGAGAHFALGVMDSISGARDVAHAELLAAYVVALTKESIEGCGKGTEIMTLHNPTIEGQEPSQLVPPQHPLTRVPHTKIQKWEQSFAARWAPRQSGTLMELAEEELADDIKQSGAQK